MYANDRIQAGDSSNHLTASKIRDFAVYLADDISHVFL